MTYQIDYTFQLTCRKLRERFLLETVERHWEKVCEILRRMRGYPQPSTEELAMFRTGESLP